MSDKEVLYYMTMLLGGLNVAQFVFWGLCTHTLINKLMSKNFAEYDLIKKGPPKGEPGIDEDGVSKEEEQEILNELNGHFKAI